MLKKQRFSFYVAAAAALCALLALVLFIVSNGTVGYPILNSSLAIYCTLGAFTACVCSLLAQIKTGMSCLYLFCGWWPYASFSWL